MAAISGMMLCPTAAQAHGEQLMVLPISGVLAFIAASIIVIRAHATRFAKLLTLILGFPVLTLLTWSAVATTLDPSPEAV